MTNQEKDILSILFSENIHGPFVTFVLTTHIAHQDINQDVLALKNMAKSAKSRFEKKYPDLAWAPFQEKIDELLNTASFWRRATKSVTIILTETDTYIKRLHVPIEDQYYVGDRPYLLGIIKNNQFNYHYYLLALNRDSMQLYEVDGINAIPKPLPENAPTTLVKALGDELTSSSLNYTTQGGSGSNSGSKEGIAYHGVNTKDEEVEIDWTNYYQAIDNYFKEQFENPEKLPIRLYALSENQTFFKKIAKNPYFDSSTSFTASPAQATLTEIENGAKKINEQLEQIETKSYNKLLDKKFVDQLIDIIPAANDGRLSHFFIPTSNLVKETDLMSSEEFDRRKLLNNIAYTVIEKGGKVFVLDQKLAPDEKSLVAILRY
ncbi:baeRF6 domain-containing protein [Enterococcus sp. LJL99]